MIAWIPLVNPNTVEEIIEISNHTPCIIFKHSTRCSISSLAKHRLESGWDFKEEHVKPYFLDLISYREISNLVADRFGISHESPQLLLIRNGAYTYEASHLDINAGELKEYFQS